MARPTVNLKFGKKKNTLELSWKGEDDPQEPTARPREYIVYTRIGYGGFDNGTLVSKTSHTVKIEPGLRDLVINRILLYQKY